MRGASGPAAGRGRTPALGGLLVGGLLVGGTAIAATAVFSGNGTAPDRSRIPVVRVLGVNQSTRCAELTAALTARRRVDTGEAIACDQQESAQMDLLRRHARARGEHSVAGSSPTCSAVDRRAAAGDPTLDFDLAFHCRQRERFAARANELDGVTDRSMTSLCRGVEARRARGEPVAPFPEAFCAHEATRTPTPGGSPRPVGSPTGWP